MRDAGVHVLRGLRAAGRWFSGVLGADKYERYLDHHRLRGDGTPPLSRREFWREWQDHQQAHPEGRCC